ncbi:hypothetical protein FF38_02048 [Lucilia cuprina]|uniref:Kazal-like domain-containing protein n=1 Tax=Lucilia cuprina TaxID=7375 RepID=A0A0L0BW71_LUCCU|nr:hypothetical protein FF38_02048 [Lucilia cuprina]
MHLAISCIIALLHFFFCVMGGEDNFHCIKPCPFVFKPICATIENPEGKLLDCTFPNDCFMRIFTCMYGKIELEHKPEHCKTYPSECVDIIMGTLSISNK